MNQGVRTDKLTMRYSKGLTALADLSEKYPKGDFRAEALFRIAWLERRAGHLPGALASLSRIERAEIRYAGSDYYGPWGAVTMISASPTITCRRRYFSGSACGSSRVLMMGRLRVVSSPTSASKKSARCVNWNR